MIRRGTFHSVDELERAICAWLATWNEKPKAFVWKATADVILEAGGQYLAAIRALELLGREAGMFQQRVEVTGLEKMSGVKAQNE